MAFKKLTYFILAGILIAGCKKKHPDPETAPETLSNGFLILNEGLFQQNNSTLGWYSRTSGNYTANFFEQKTNRGLGDTGNDLQRYGGKVYLVVNVSSTLEILDAQTGNSLKQIQMQANNQAKQPRYIRFYDSKAYITCYDGYVDVLDTASLTITNRIQVGSNPEGLTFSNGKMFVANSGGLNAPLMDSTVSVIDLSSETEITKIKVGMNPGGIISDNTGEVYVITRGNYTNVPSRMHRINPVTLQVEEDFTFDVSGISVMNDQFLYSYYDYTNSNQAVGVFDPQTETITQPNLINTSSITTLYGVQYLPSLDRIVCFDAKNYTATGEVFFFHTDGSFDYKIQAGLNPSKMISYE